MKNNKLAFLSFLAVAFVSVSANAGDYEDFEDFYLSGKAGVILKTQIDTTDTSSAGVGATTEESNSIEDSLSLSGAVGYQIDDLIRSEAELSYRSHDGFDVYSGMANIYFNTPLIKEKFFPYVGAGLGIALVDSDEVEENTSIAYQGMAGIDYKLNERGTIFGGYRYFGTTDFSAVDSIGTYDFRVQQHILEVGYRYKF
jgi:opacity protein-like surface antigen